MVDGVDLVEVSPPNDHSEITALPGSTLLLQMVWQLASQK